MLRTTNPPLDRPHCTPPPTRARSSQAPRGPTAVRTAAAPRGAELCVRASVPASVPALLAWPCLPCPAALLARADCSRGLTDCTTRLPTAPATTSTPLIFCLRLLAFCVSSCAVYWVDGWVVVRGAPCMCLCVCRATPEVGVHYPPFECHDTLGNKVTSSTLRNKAFALFAVQSVTVCVCVCVSRAGGQCSCVRGQYRSSAGRVRG